MSQVKEKKMTPMQQVKQQYGGRKALVEAIMPLLETKDEVVRGKLMGTANSKLLRIHDTAKVVREKFGSRKSLVEKILAARYPKGKPDDGFLKRVEEASLKRLLDMHRQIAG